MKVFCCPDCKVIEDTCTGCQRYYSTPPPSNVLNEQNPLLGVIDSFSYKCCENCPNNPKNGGSGICNCTLPYFESPFYYTGIDTSQANDMTCTTTTTGYYYTKNLTNITTEESGE